MLRRHSTRPHSTSSRAAWRRRWHSSLHDELCHPALCDFAALRVEVQLVGHHLGPQQGHVAAKGWVWGLFCGTVITPWKFVVSRLGLTVGQAMQGCAFQAVRTAQADCRTGKRAACQLAGRSLTAPPACAWRHRSASAPCAPRAGCRAGSKAAASHIIKVLCWALVAGKKACHTLPADPARTQHRPLPRQPVQAAACPPARQHRPPAPAPRLPVASKAARAPHLKLYAVPGRPWKTSMLGSRHFTM